jgi:hypothetical protein
MSIDLWLGRWPATNLRIEFVGAFDHAGGEESRVLLKVVWQSSFRGDDWAPLTIETRESLLKEPHTSTLSVTDACPTDALT